MKDDCETTQPGESSAGQSGPADTQGCSDSPGRAPLGGRTPRRMSTPRNNFWVDFASAVVLCAMLGTGVLLKWILPPGRSGGRGLVWLGEDRHFWGDVHFWLAVVMLALVVVHLVLHRSWVANCWRRFVGSVRSPATWAIRVTIWRH